jgi:DNA-binding CsgD family transcriptional regulator
MAPIWLIDGRFYALPRAAILNATVTRAVYFSWTGQYELSLTIAQTALAFLSYAAVVSHEDIYLCLICAIACCALERENEAERYILDAVNRAEPHGFIAPFAEGLCRLGGHLEKLVKPKFPLFYHAVVEQWKHTRVNWLTFHNRFAKDNVTLILTLREYQIAVLVSQRVSRAKIAVQFGISKGRVSNIIDVIYGKLYISSKTELEMYIL